jgi:hypothetical protein
MISIIKKPYPISFSKNNIDFEVQTNMYFKSIFVYPSIEIEIDSLPDIGEHYLIKWTNPDTFQLQEVSLVAVDGSDEDNYSNIFQIPDSSWSGTIEEYRDLVLEKLRFTPVLNGDYSIDALSTDKITLTANKAVQELVPTWTTNQASTHLSAVIQNGFVNPDPRDGYDMVVHVYFEKDLNSGHFERVASLSCTVDEDSKSIIDISDVLNSEIENTWTEYPVPFNKELYYIAPNTKRYYVKFIESWTGESQFFETISDVQHVHWGGVSTDDQMIADPATMITNGNNFLTWWPTGKRIDIDQDDWLGWMNQYMDKTFDVQVFIVTNIGESDFTLHSEVSIKKFECLIFNTGYEANSLEELVPGETILKWSFAIKKSDGGWMSPQYTFYPETRCERKIIQYFNSFGIPETFNTTKDWKENMNVKTEIANRSAAFGLNRLFPQNFVFDSKHQNSIKAVSGNLTNEEAIRLQSMVNSTIAFIQENKRWIPCVLNTGKTDIVDYTEYFQRIELDILKANENDRASFFNIQPDLDFTVGYGIEKVSVIDNGLQIDGYGDISVYSGSDMVGTFAWDLGQLCYLSGSPFIIQGDFRFECELVVGSEVFAISKHFMYEFQEILLSYYGTGDVQFKFQSVTGFAGLIIDWGDGTVDTILYSTTLTDADHTYTATGKKIIRLMAPNFEALKAIQLMNDFGPADFSLLVNAQTISYFDGSESNFYFSQLEKVKLLFFSGTTVSNFYVGFQKDLEGIVLSNTSITSEALDELIYELWQYRKLYTNAVLFNCGPLGFSTSAYFNSIKDGTGEFAGEGLLTNYGWTFTIT